MKTTNGLPPPGQVFWTAAAKRLRRFKPAAAGTVGAEEIGVAELADGRAAVFFAPRPQVAAGEAAEHRRPPRVRAFALKRVINFLDRKHDASCLLSEIANFLIGLTV